VWADFACRTYKTYALYQGDNRVRVPRTELRVRCSKLELLSDSWEGRKLLDSNKFVSSLGGFRHAVLNDDCAVARGNEPIHRGNTTSQDVYVLEKDAQCVRRCCIAQCSIWCIQCSQRAR